jgi:hypothetical protein
MIYGSQEPNPLPPWLQESSGRPQYGESVTRTRRDYAKRYASLGWAVFPCHHVESGNCSCGKSDCKSPGKHPLTTHGVKDATTDVAQITTWWEQWPEANIAVACGKVSGIVVMDVDPRNRGDESLESIIAEQGPLPDTVMAMTGGGGEHHVFKYQDGSRFPKLPGIDFQSDGQYIIVEPSTHLSGTAYAWEGSSDPLEGVVPASIPEWLFDTAPRTEASVISSGEVLEYADPKTIADLRSALNFLRADDRDVWARHGMRLKTLGDVGRELWLTWSQTSDAWQAGDAMEWDTFNPDYTGYRAVFSEAQEAGWRNPLSKIGPTATASEAETAQPAIFIRADQFAAEIQPTCWLIKGFLETDCLTQIFGKHSSGKSFMAIDWALSIATGRPWNGCRTKQQAVIYIAGEGQNGLSKRINAWALHYKQDLTNQPIYFSKQPLSLLNQQTAANACESITHIATETSQPIGLIVIDTLARNFGDGDENSTRDMNRFIEHLDQYLRVPFGANILIVHHAGHVAQGRGRGASSLPAAINADYQMSIDNGVAIMTNQKMKDGAKPDETHYSLTEVDLGISDEDGEPVTSCVLKPIEHAGVSKKMGGKQRDLIELFIELCDRESARRIHYDTIRKEAILAGFFSNSSMSTMKRSIDSLCNRGILGEEGGYLIKGNKFNELCGF